MLPTAIIVFREILEAALVVSIVMVATKGVSGRGRWVGLGIGTGILGAGLVAGFAGAIAQAAAGMGQEVFNASVLFIAVAMLGWHSIWMGRHGRDMARQIGAVGKAVTAGARPLYALAVVVGIAVLREGSEAVLFLYGIAASDPGQSGEMLVGGMLGILGGVGLGMAMYYGLLQISTRYLFTVTTWLIILLAAGMASSGAAFLVQAGYLPSLGTEIWNTAWLLKDSTLLGKTLHAMIGYTARPAGIQIAFYLATFLVIGTLTWMFGSDRGGTRAGAVSLSKP